MLLLLNYKTLQSRKADEVRHRAAEAVWLRYAPQRPPPLNHPSGFAANVTKPHAEHQSRSGRPLRDDSEPVALTIRSSMSYHALATRPALRSPITASSG